MKTLDIQAREWFDRIPGNSYFSAVITIDYGMNTEQTIPINFMYGYENYYEYAAFEELKKRGLIETDERSLSKYCKNNGIALRSSIQRDCLKRDVINFTKNK